MIGKFYVSIKNFFFKGFVMIEGKNDYMVGEYEF